MQLVLKVRKCEPSKKSISSDPLILRFVSNSLNADEYALVCFSTRSHPMEIAFAQLFWAACGDSTYTLTVRGVGGRRQLDCVDEQVFCVSLARRACDWEMRQLFVGEPGSDLSIFQIVGEQPFSKDDLEEWARRAKQEQEQMALRAARLAQKLTSAGQKASKAKGTSSGRAGGKGRGKKRKKKEGADFAEVFASQSTASEEYFGFSEEEMEKTVDKEEAAASSSQVPPNATSAPPSSSPAIKTGGIEEARKSKPGLSLGAI